VKTLDPERTEVSVDPGIRNYQISVPIDDDREAMRVEFRRRWMELEAFLWPGPMPVYLGDGGRAYIEVPELRSLAEQATTA
jgi:hypothetical protein